MEEIKFWQPTKEQYPDKGIYTLDEAEAAMIDCKRRGELVLGFGGEITNFEKSFANYIGVKHAIMVGSGTQALRTAYQAIGIAPGDEVITTDHTFIATIDQIVAAGAKPVLVDIGEDGLIDPTEVEKAITTKTKAVVPVHLEGKICEMERIGAVTSYYNTFKERNIFIIEDAAQAIGATYQSEHYDGRAGSIGNAGCFSLYPAKILGCVGNAGAITTDDDLLAERARMIRCNYNIGRANKSIEDAEYGHNFEPDSIQAAVLNVKMKYLDERIARRREIAERYDAAFRTIPGLPLQLPWKQVGRVYQDYVLRASERKHELIKFLQDAGIGVTGYDLIPNHYYKKLRLNYHLPKTDKYLAEQFRIPCNPDLTDAEVGYIIGKVQEFYSK